MIGRDPGFPVYGAAINELIGSIALQSGYEENALRGQHAKPGIADIAFIEGDDGTLWQ